MCQVQLHRVFLGEEFTAWNTVFTPAVVLPLDEERAQPSTRAELQGENTTQRMQEGYL